MKCTEIAKLLVVGLLLGSSVVGCKHGPQNVTPLPKRGEGLIPDDTSHPPPIVPPVSPNTGFTPQPPIPTPQPPIQPETPTKPIEVPTGGGEQTGAPRDVWNQDRNMFSEQTVYFEFDKAAIKSSEIPKLETVASKFKTLPGTKALRIEGHCDERGTEEYNRSLGERRALAVREKLASLGIEAKDIETISFGEDKPVDPGHNEAAWSKNRRGEIILLTPPGAK